ncbi:unnamed protein product [Rotaria sp. Silwood1]|nr:unnamed protein product [Rotaria sp. Silwood1]
MTISLLYLLLQNCVPIPSSCIRTFMDFLVHENIELRKHAEKSIAAICRLQKPPRIYIEKSLDEILYNVGQSIPTLVDGDCQPGDRHDNLWVTIDGYKQPETQTEWEQTCFLDNSFYGYYTWPKIIKYSMNKRERYTANNMPEQVAILYERFIDKNFIQQSIQLMVFDEEKNEIKFDKTRFLMFKVGESLFRNFGLTFVDNFMEQLYILIREKTKDKHEGSHRTATEIVAGMIRGSKHWTLEMENEDPRRMHRLIEFIYLLINNYTTANTFNETARWYLIQNLRCFQWRIPSIWCTINEHAKQLLDHPSKAVRERIAHVLAISFSFDITLFNGRATRHPDINQCIDTICERLRQAIDIYEKTPRINISDQILEVQDETRKAFNFIETVVQFHTNLFLWCEQPVKNAIIRIFPYLCEIESIAANDEGCKHNLTISRNHLGMAYLHVHFLEALIQQLEQVCTSPKWNARRAAIQFVQSMIFWNLFNARPYAQRLHGLVLKCLFDEQLEIRIVASTTLSGFYQCDYIQVTPEDLNHFRAMSKTNYFTKINGKKVTSARDVVKRHGGQYV